MLRNFHWDQSELTSPWHYAGDIEYVREGLRMWCRNGKGAYIMLDAPQTRGTWTVRTRISGPSPQPTTKICGLLWPVQTPDKGDLPIWPPEIDFNESGIRTESHQTLHFGTRAENFMIHKGYEADQQHFHDYTVRVDTGRVGFLYDNIEQTYIDRDVPDVVGYEGRGWNLHLRTEPNGHDDETALDVRRIFIGA